MSLVNEHVVHLNQPWNAYCHHGYENMGNGVLWEDMPQADISLKHLLEEELLLRYNLKVA